MKKNSDIFDTLKDNDISFWTQTCSTKKGEAITIFVHKVYLTREQAAFLKELGFRSYADYFFMRVFEKIKKEVKSA